MVLTSDLCCMPYLSWKPKPRAVSRQLKTRTAHFECQVWPVMLSKPKNRPSSEISCLQAIAGCWARAWQVGIRSFQSTFGRCKEKATKEVLSGRSANADMILMSKCIPQDVHSWECSSEAGQDSCEDPCLSGRLKSCLPQRAACWQPEHPSVPWGSERHPQPLGGNDRPLLGHRVSSSLQTKVSPSPALGAMELPCYPSLGVFYSSPAL